MGRRIETIDFKIDCMYICMYVYVCMYVRICVCMYSINIKSPCYRSIIYIYIYINKSV